MNRVLNGKEIEEIAKLYVYSVSDNITIREIAKGYNISKSTIGRVLDKNYVT